jgi:hypothetical protein
MLTSRVPPRVLAAVLHKEFVGSEADKFLLVSEYRPLTRGGSVLRAGRAAHLSYEFFIGMRYTRAKRRSDFISFVSLVSVICIALGMTVLITVLSVMNGFQREIRTRILGVASHVQLSGEGGTLADWQGVATRAARHEQVVATAPFVSAQGLLTHGSAVRGVVVRGVLPEHEDRVADIGRHMRSGRLENLKPGEYGVVLGVDLARALGVAPGERVVLVAPQGQVTPAGSDSSRWWACSRLTTRSLIPASRCWRSRTRKEFSASATPCRACGSS